MECKTPVLVCNKSNYNRQKGNKSMNIIKEDEKIGEEFKNETVSIKNCLLMLNESSKNEKFSMNLIGNTF